MPCDFIQNVLLEVITARAFLVLGGAQGIRRKLFFRFFRLIGS